MFRTRAKRRKRNPSRLPGLTDTLRIAGRRVRATMAGNQQATGGPAMSSLASKQGPRYRHIADETEPYETIAVEKLTPIIGAEISGVDIGKLVSGGAGYNPQIDERRRSGGGKR